MERWLPVVGYEGLYEISDSGRARSLNRRDGRGWKIKGRILALRALPKGYLRVQLHRNGKARDVYIHTLVLEAFVEPRPKGMETRHIDGNPANNALENLEWGTALENAHDKRLHGTDKRSQKLQCKHGHPMTEENTAVESSGFRACKQCKRDRTRKWMREYRARIKEKAA